MNIKSKALKYLSGIVIVSSLFIACDEEFTSIDSDIINEDTATNFNTVTEKFELISYTNSLNPVQTNGLGINLLGVYNDPTSSYDQTIANIVTQLNSAILEPDFGENPELESVELSIPFFSRNVGLSEDGEGFDYELDSIVPNNPNMDGTYAPIKLSMFENNYFLRDFDPNDDFNSGQLYFSDKSVSSSEQISNANLEAIPITVIDELLISNKEILITEGEGEDEVITQRLAPRIREIWDKDNPEDAAVIQYWFQKIIQESIDNPSSLSNSNNFNDYFRGLYFKAEPINGNGSMLILNLSDAAANITLTYSFDSETEESGRGESTYVLTFNPTRVNFFENNFSVPDGDPNEGDENLFLKGPNLSTATIKLPFTSTNPNSTISDFDSFREAFANYNSQNGEFESFRRLINEASLVFHVNQDQLNGEEPDRLYLYDKTNNRPLSDYFLDNINNTLPQASLLNHLGVLERVDDDPNGEGILYKMRLTNHINNLLLNDAENVELGLAISGNVNLEATVPQYREQTAGSEEEFVPVSIIINPRGTILHGNKSEDPTKRLYLEIIYTCIDNCPPTNN